jgi:hypothetical protein
VALCLHVASLEPFASVYDDGSRLGVILARGRGGFEAYAADNHSLGLFPSPRKAAAAITTTRPWVAHTTAEDKPERGQGSICATPRKYLVSLVAMEMQWR